MRLPTTSDNGIIDLLDRILDRGIIMDPTARLLLASMDLRSPGTRILIAPERRRRPFVVPQHPRRITIADLRRPTTHSEKHKHE